MSSYYNEGVGHGGFVATFATAGSVVIETFDKDLPSSNIIMQSDQRGAPTKWAGVSGFPSAVALAQLPVTGSGDAVQAVEIVQGDYFTAPATHGGGVWVVTGASEAFRVGDYFKSNLQLLKKLNI